MVRGLTLLLMIAVTDGLVTAQKPVDPRRDPVAAVADMLRLVERKDFVTLLKTYAAPEQLKKFTDSTTIEQAAAELAEERGADLLAALRTAAKVTPELNPENTRARFRFPAPVAGDSRLTLVKIGDYWYLQ